MGLHSKFVSSALSLMALFVLAGCEQRGLVEVSNQTRPFSSTVGASAELAGPPKQSPIIPEVILRDPSAQEFKVLSAAADAPLYGSPITGELFKVGSFNGLLLGVPIIKNPERRDFISYVLPSITYPQLLPAPAAAQTPQCSESRNICGLNYSSPYDTGSKTCRITYFAAGTDYVVAATQVFYTNCGTCREAAVRDRIISSLEGPVYQASHLVCTGGLELDAQFRSMPNFEIETLAGSTCAQGPQYFSMARCSSR